MGRPMRMSQITRGCISRVVDWKGGRTENEGDVREVNEWLWGSRDSERGRSGGDW